MRRNRRERNADDYQREFLKALAGEDAMSRRRNTEGDGGGCRKNGHRSWWRCTHSGAVLRPLSRFAGSLLRPLCRAISCRRRLWSDYS